MIDQATLDALSEDLGEDVVVALLGDYLATTGDLVAQVGAGLVAGSIDKARAAAHSIKGSAGSVGMTGDQATSKAVEDACRAGDLEGARGLFPALEASHRDTRAFLATRYGLS